MEIDSGISADYLPMDPKRLLEIFHTALNSRDLTNLIRFMQTDFEQTWPGQKGKLTTGLEAVRQMWKRIFDTYPDFRADLIRHAIENNVIWSEWHWEGHAVEKNTRINQAGVIIFGIEEGLLAWVRYYLVDAEEDIA